MNRIRFEQQLARRATRRCVLAGGLGLAGLATSLSLPGRPTHGLAAARRAMLGTTPAFGGTPFTLGVASGDPMPDGVVLWTRLAPDPVNGGGMDPVPVDLAWEVAVDDAFRRIVQTGSATAHPELAHSVHVDVTGLDPGREYFYRFMVGSEVSPVGRTKTAPATGAGLDVCRVAFASCAHYEHGWFTAYRGLAAEDLDLILHLGDYIYEYPTGEEFLPASGVIVREHGSGEVVMLEEYRNRHALYKTDPDLQAAHAAAPWAVTWDDHEVDNNYAGPYSANGDPVDAFLERRANAYQAYYEHMPLRPESMPLGPDMRLYRRLTFGDLIAVSVLDTRQYRTDHPCGDGVQVRCPAALEPAATMIGPEQERWLLAGLDASVATWNVIAQQVMMAQLDTNISPEDEYASDIWDGYPVARNRILGHLLDAGTSNPVVLTGDVHSAWVNDLKADWDDPASATIATEFVTTSITSDNPYGPQLGGLRLLNPHVRFFDHLHGYARCEVRPDRWQTDFLVVEDATDPNGTVAPKASWVVEAGTPGAQPA
jgi:alkaline phosphatase D